MATVESAQPQSPSSTGVSRGTMVESPAEPKKVSGSPQGFSSSHQGSIPLTLISLSKTNPRKQFEGSEFDELVASVKQHGVLQPVLVRKLDLALVNRPGRCPTCNSPKPNRHPAVQFEGEVEECIDSFHAPLELVCGERRYRAAKQAGLKEIPAVVRELSDDQAREIQIVENLQRSDVTPMEEAQGYASLFNAYKQNSSSDYPRQKLIEEMARKVGKSTRYIYARMKLAEDAAPELQQAVRDGKLDVSHADELVRLPKAEQTRMVREILAAPGEKPSVRDVKKAVQQEQAKTPSGGSVFAPSRIRDERDDMAERCRQLGRLLRKDIDLRGEILEELSGLKYDAGSPFSDQLLAFIHGVELDADALRIVRDGMPKDYYGLPEQHVVNAQVSVNRAVFEINRGQPDWSRVEDEALSAMRSLHVVLAIRHSKVKFEPNKKKVSTPPPPPEQSAAGAKAKIGKGVCRVCGCKPGHRCVLKHSSANKGHVVTCKLLDGGRGQDVKGMVCSNPECVKKARAQVKAEVKTVAAKTSAKQPAKKAAKKSAAKKGGRA